MSRVVKRVPVDFQWPLGSVWTGYLNPHYDNVHQCESCEGTGYSPEGKIYHDEWYVFITQKGESVCSAVMTSDGQWIDGVEAAVKGI